MNTFTNSTRALGIAFAALLLLALPFAYAHKAHAADFGLGDWYDTGYYDTWSPDYSYGGGSNDWYDTGYYDTWSPSYGSNDWTDTGYYDTWSPSYGSGYGSSFPMTYGSGSGFGSGFPFGGGGMPGITNVNQNQNQNTCTAGSCNTSTAINAPTTVSTIAYPQPTYQQPYQQYQQPNYYPQQPTYSPPVSYNKTPYVSLSAVPYTGLDLGPWGTAAYWGFLVLWCLGAAYLIAVKKIHYKMASWFVGGSAAKNVAETRAEVRHSAPKAQTKATNRVPEAKLGGIDPFIASQINRAAF